MESGVKALKHLLCFPFDTSVLSRIALTNDRQWSLPTTLRTLCGRPNAARGFSAQKVHPLSVQK
jgi:hypothetical protein